ncbi:hypothetical protein NV379_02555 [Paenibacillus sp. N1-5-1-14]|uniref:hypothetical protein n=1 Tax=Paenibacillus radicibacter TaxID=2972488 RepID=UPI0021597F8D|nr:hypothetical protein [Paenibacillus radicibacter]MCR8641528.1 hypothetical protein [Paenibacillus radicibacter]
MKMRNQVVKDWLYELGYDERKYLDHEGIEMASFMKECRNEQLLEARKYIEFIEDCNDESYLK